MLLSDLTLDEAVGFDRAKSRHCCQNAAIAQNQPQAEVQFDVVRFPSGPYNPRRGRQDRLLA